MQEEKFMLPEKVDIATVRAECKISQFNVSLETSGLGTCFWLDASTVDGLMIGLREIERRFPKKQLHLTVRIGDDLEPSIQEKVAEILDKDSLKVGLKTDLHTCHDYRIIDGRTANCLLRGGIRTIGELLELLSSNEGIATLLEIRNLGEKSVNQLRKLTKEQPIGKTFRKPTSPLGHGMFASPSCLKHYRLGDWQETYKVADILLMNIDMIIDRLCITTHLEGALQKFVKMCVKLHPETSRSSIGLPTIASHTLEEVSELTTPKYAQLLMYFIGEFGLKFRKEE